MIDNDVQIAVAPGADKLTADSLFQFGSITKTMTGILLAECVVRGETTLEATVGSVLGHDAGAVCETTLASLATQRSGLPRLPPNLDLRSVDRGDPYANYSEDDLLDALRLVARPSPGQYQYSNFGFMLLGLVLSRICGTSYARVVEQRMLVPFGMRSALCGVPGEDRLPGYRGRTRVGWWRTQVPGAGGTGGSIRDLLQYVLNCLSPSAVLREAVQLATRKHAMGTPVMGLGWVHHPGGFWWHNGATGGFRSFLAFHPPTASGVALLANGHDANVLDRVGFRVLADIVRSRT